MNKEPQDKFTRFIQDLEKVKQVPWGDSKEEKEKKESLEYLIDFCKKWDELDNKFIEMDKRWSEIEKRAKE